MASRCVFDSLQQRIPEIHHCLATSPCTKNIKVHQHIKITTENRQPTTSKTLLATGLEDMKSYDLTQEDEQFWIKETKIHNRPCANPSSLEKNGL